MKRIGIIGTRQRNQYEDFLEIEKKFLDLYEEGDWIVSGGCPTGGDHFAWQLAKKYRCPYLEFPANWDKHGKQAGFIRNNDIAEWSDFLIACLPADGKSSGTQDTMKKFRAKFGGMNANLIIV